MICYQAAWVVPISSPPIRRGWVIVDEGRVIATGSGDGHEQQRRIAGAGAGSGFVVQDLGNVVLMPGLVNAHTHLELSHLGKSVAPAPHFVDWVRQMLALRRQYQDPSDPVILQGVQEGIAEAIRSGTAVVGDISNTLVTFAPLAASSLAALVFYELIGFRSTDPLAIVDQASRQLASLAPTRRVRASLAGHAPYSVAPALLRAIREAVERDRRAPYSVHLSESGEEVEFIARATGPWRVLLEELGAWEPSWVGHGGTPVEYLAANGFLGPRALVVHGVQMSGADLARLAGCGATLVTCPRSNAYTGAGIPPIEQFYASGVRVAVGTDSLASTPDLNLFSELAAMRRIAPSVPASALLDSATRQGANALGFAEDYGTIEAGKCARLLGIAVPAGIGDASDVEEYLVSGILPDQLSWT